MQKILFYILIVLSVFSVLRILLALLLANIHDIQIIKTHYRRTKSFFQPRKQSISVIIPAFNEESTIKRCVESVYDNSYPNKQVIVVNDGSTDQTLPILIKLKHEYPSLVLVNQRNQGKAAALNNGIINYSNGSLVMVLDADSWLAKDTLEKMNLHFQNHKVIAASCNVRIGNPLKLVEWAQYLEYFLSYHIKGSEQILNLLYIIGGVGSTFRRRALVKVGGYDTNCVTEDIDMTVKLLSFFGNLHHRFVVASDAIAYTPPCHTFGDLLKQRLRWKAGRFTTLFKYHQLLFHHDADKFSWTLTCWKLPKVFFEELLIFCDPFLIAYMFSLMIIYSNPFTIIGLFGFYAVITLSCTIADNRTDLLHRIELLLIVPVSVCFLYIINLVDFISLLRCLKRMPNLVHPKAQTMVRWQHVER